MSRRGDPKARQQLTEAAATGRRRAQVQEQSSRQRDVALRSRRLAAELSGSGGGLSEAALASLGPDVLAERVKLAAAALRRWSELPPSEWQTALQQLTTLLSTGSHQPAEAALAGEAVSSLAALLQLPSPHLPHGAARRAAWALELLANSGPDAGREVAAAAPALVGTLASAVAAAAGAAAAVEETGSGGHGLDVGAGGEELLLVDQLAAVLGAAAAWGPDHQAPLIAHGAVAPLLQLLLVTLAPAGEAKAAPDAAPASVQLQAMQADAMEQEGMQSQVQQPQQQVQQVEEPPLCRCCTTALWSLGMLVRGRADETLQLASQPALLAGLRRVLLAPSAPPGLVREAAWLLAFCSAAGGPDVVAALVSGGGLLPGLLLSSMRLVQQAAALSGDDPAAHDAAQPLHQALLPLLAALANIAAEPSQTHLVLSELQASRPLPASPPPAGAAAAGAAATGAGTDGGVSASGMQALLACLQDRVSHRGVVRSAAALAAGLAWGACRAGAVTLDAARGALRAAGVVDALAGLLRGAALDIRKEAAAALASLCQGAADGGAGGGPAAAEPGPGSLDMLRSLGVSRGADEQGVLAAFLGLLRSPDADAVHVGLRFVTLVLTGLRRGGPQLVESLDGIDALEAVQYGTGGCRVPELQAWAEELVDTHYGEDYGEGDDGEEGEEEEGAMV